MNHDVRKERFRKSAHGTLSLVLNEHIAEPAIKRQVTTMPGKEEFTSISFGSIVKHECNEKAKHIHTDAPKVRYANSRHINFYKNHDINAYKRPIYQTKIISSP